MNTRTILVLFMVAVLLMVLIPFVILVLQGGLLSVPAKDTASMFNGAVFTVVGCGLMFKMISDK